MSLNSLREEIDVIDWRILKLIKKRFHLVAKIKSEKSKQGLPIKDQYREKDIMERLNIGAKKLKLSSRFVAEIFKLIIKESRKIQTETLSHPELVSGSKLDAELNSA